MCLSQQKNSWEGSPSEVTDTIPDRLFTSFKQTRRYLGYLKGEEKGELLKMKKAGCNRDKRSGVGSLGALQHRLHEKAPHDPGTTNFIWSITSTRSTSPPFRSGEQGPIPEVVTQGNTDRTRIN